jgi:hypothetical protein
MEIQVIYLLLPVTFTMLFILYYRRFIYKRKWEVKIADDSGVFKPVEKVTLNHDTFNLPNHKIDAKVYGFMNQSLPEIESQKSLDLLDKLKPFFKEFYSTYQIGEVVKSVSEGAIPSRYETGVIEHAAKAYSKMGADAQYDCLLNLQHALNKSTEDGVVGPSEQKTIDVFPSTFNSLRSVVNLRAEYYKENKDQFI